MKKKAIIISINGFFLTTREKILLRKERPWGIILFKRNIRSIKQVKKLTYNIRHILKDSKYPILIDEEGGNVSRLSKIIDNKIFSQKLFGDIYSKDKKISISLYKNYILSINSILKEMGININTIPVLDMLHTNTHQIIGNRSYSKKKEIIKKLGQICVNANKKDKILSVVKHIPGHGRAKSDSHFKLPIIKETYKNLISSDFECFMNINSHFVMTAHILYKKIDKFNCATHSKKIIKEIIRKKIKFKGIIISDDISMKALKYNLVQNAIKSLEAGCNIVLYCAGKTSQSEKLLGKIPNIDKFTQKKTSEFYKFLS